jgi:glycosyltransferase involved in cell wall biosynthesis
MNQVDFTVVERSNLKSPVVIINQCNQDRYQEYVIHGNTVRMYSTRERGLSRSRNSAISKATKDICLLCDDDEVFVEGYEDRIVAAYEKYSDADIIAFRVLRDDKVYWDKPKRVGFLKSLKISSVQLTFKRRKIIDHNVFFDESFGSGTANSSGEENIFLYDCLRKDLKIYYVPDTIASLNQGKSNWFKGFTNDYFFRKGILAHRLMGRVGGTVYALYFAISKFGRYRKETPFSSALRNLLRGVYSVTA